MTRPRRDLQRPSELVPISVLVLKENRSVICGVFANRDAASASRVACVDFACDLFAEDRELARSAVANELVVYPVGVMPRFLVCFYRLIH